MPNGMVVLGGGVLCGYKGKCPSTVAIPSNVTSLAGNAFSEWLPRGIQRPRRGMGLSRSDTGPKMVIISSSVKRFDKEAFFGCHGLTDVTMLGECPEAPGNIFKDCDNLKSIHVPANAKSWAGMKEWQGIPLVFDAEEIDRQVQVERGDAPGGALARLRERRMRLMQEQQADAAARRAAEEEAEKERREAEAKAAADRERLRAELLQIQEELRRQREEMEKRRREDH